MMLTVTCMGLIGLFIIPNRISSYRPQARDYDDSDSSAANAISPGVRLAELLIKRLKCISTGGHCYSNVQCCFNLICLTSLYENIQGKADLKKQWHCMKTRDLKPCESKEDCVGTDATTGQCLLLAGRSGQKYCLPVTSPEVSSNSALKLLDEKSEQATNRTVPIKHLGGIGSPCRDTSDCQMTSYASYNSNRPGSQRGQMLNRGQQQQQQQPLCCQLVRMGRQKSKFLCDPITPISVCIYSDSSTPSTPV